MGKTLDEIALDLKNANKKTQLIYAFNGTGKTRLSRAFKDLIAPKPNDEADEEGLTRKKILYYNAFTEDLFYWDNDLDEDAEPKLKIQSNSFTKWVLEVQGQEPNIIKNFQRYSSERLTPKFNQEYTIKSKTDEDIIIKAYSEVTFSYARGTDETIEKIKISKGEESNFIWSIFLSLISQIILDLREIEKDEDYESEFKNLEYIIIDDPVSSLDENHLIELAVNLAELIRMTPDKTVKFIVSTHNPLFYNVLYSELGARSGFILRNNEDGTFDLEEKKGDSNSSFSYHLFLKQIIEKAVKDKDIQKYHFTLLRNLYEKTSAFLGYPRWSELLPDDKQTYYNRIVQFTAHSFISNEAVAEPTPQEKQTLEMLFQHLVNEYKFYTPTPS